MGGDLVKGDLGKNCFKSWQIESEYWHTLCLNDSFSESVYFEL